MLTAVGLGANLGNRLGSLREAARRLEAAGTILARSDVFETAPWGVTDQPRFLNACLTLETDLSPEDLLRFLKGVERDMGRRERRRWGEREIDLDILLMEDRVIETPELRVPHAHLPDRDFVLVPLRQVLPGWRHPVLGFSIDEMLGTEDGEFDGPPLRIAAL